MKIVDDVIEKHYPTTFKQKFITKLEHNVSQYVTPTATSQDFESIFH